MEHLKSYYSLEKHLEQTVLVNPQFEILNAIWKLNKKNLSSALANVNQYFPHYSLHEKSHSNTIIHNIESFLGEERIQKLSPTDTWLILMASFTHDLGMVIFHDLVEDSWHSEDFQDFLERISDSEDVDLKESSKLLIDLQKITKEKFDNNEWISKFDPVVIKNSVIKVIAEYMRRIHHKRSADILKGIDTVFYQVANSFYSDQIPGRLLSILGEVAYLHGVEFYDIFERLDYQANGISNDKIHPRFIAAMLRLGDLLDIDDNRFNLFTEKVFQFPDSSKSHKEKHSSIKHFLITPNAIEITADCPNESVYRLARSWFDSLEKEVENQSKEWSNITPEDLGGTSPQIPKRKIKVFYKGNKANNELLNLRFQVSNDKIFKILEGASIYENAGFTFIRELIQNALDASKIQLWKEIEKGTYDFSFRQKLHAPSLSHTDILESIKFPIDIPEFLSESFSIKLTVKWENEDHKNLLIIVEDNGTGISDKDLIRMTSKVGESRKSGDEYKQMLNRMPFWLRPTAAFGIGIQSVFIITDSFKVETKADGENSKEIIFRSARNGKYSSWVPSHTNIQRGTKITVSISEENFGEVFGTSFSWDILFNYDYFTDDYGNIFIPKIWEYIRKILHQIPTLNVTFMGKDLFKEEKETISLKKITEGVNEKKTVYCRIEMDREGILFYFNENIIGSEFLLLFRPDIDEVIEEDWRKNKTEFFVRDIPVETNLISYYKLYYCKLIWNFMSPESDKILSLTREKFIDKYKEPIVADFFENVVPEAMKLSENLFIGNQKEIEELNELKSEQIAYVYFKILLTNSINKILSNINNKILGDHKLPAEMVSYIDNTTCRMADIFTADSILAAVPLIYFSQRKNIPAFINENIKIVQTHFPKNKLLFKALDYFYPYLNHNYNIENLLFTKDLLLFELTKQKKDNNESIKILEGEDIYLKKFLTGHGRLERNWNYASSKYAAKLSVLNHYKTGFENFPFLSSCSIISPFKNEKLYLSLKEEIGVKSREEINTFLTSEKIKQYVTPSLIKWIINHHPSSKITEDIILEGYRELITDLLLIS